MEFEYSKEVGWYWNRSRKLPGQLVDVDVI